VSNRLILRTRADYRRALARVNELRDQGAIAETNQELANLEGAIARYVAKPGRPAFRKGRPKG
jgi:hypothetical protein